LKYYRHDDVCLMDGGRKKWVAENRPLTQTLPGFEIQTYTMRGRNRDLRALRDYVASALGKAGFGLVDVRSPKEFSG
jgi:thiosulfate/3-mercaptopyruvate sulfurtransferase